METKETKGAMIVSVSISQDFYNKGRELGVSWSAVFKKGLSITFKEETWGCDIWEKLRNLTEKLSEISQKYNETLEKKHARKAPKLAQKGVEFAEKRAKSAKKGKK